MGRSRKSHGKRSGKVAAAPSAPAAAAPASAAQRRHVWWLPLGVAVLVLVLLGIWWSRVPAPGVATTPVATVTSSSAQPTAVLPPSHYVGAQTCAACHAKETQAWQSSHHALAMQVADDKTVAGHFDGALKQDGSVASFFKRDHAYFVKTDGPDGKPGEFEVKYTLVSIHSSSIWLPFPTAGCRPCARHGMHVPLPKVASTGSISIPANVSTCTTPCTGRA